MIGDESVELWLNQYKMEALETALGEHGGSVESKMQEFLEKLYEDMVPEETRRQIDARLQAEYEADKTEAEAKRRFAVFHVTEDGSSTHFLTEGEIDILYAAERLRSYIRRSGENQLARFTGMFSRGEQISREQFEAFAAERLDNTGRVTGAFDVDLDKGTFEALHIMDGWQRFRIQDVSTAAYFAMKKTSEYWDARRIMFLDRLDGKQLTQDNGPVYLSGKSTLRAEDVSFAGDLVQNEEPAWPQGPVM